VSKISEELTDLAKLHSDGSLSDEEFTQLKARLISGTEQGVPTEQKQSDQVSHENQLTKSQSAIWQERFLARNAKVAAVVLMVLAIAAFAYSSVPGLSGPDCDSKESIGLALQIAKQNGVLLQTIQRSLFTAYATKHGRIIAEARAASLTNNPPKYVFSSPPPMWCRDKSHNPTWADYHAQCFNHDPTLEEIIQSDPGPGTGAGTVFADVQQEMDRDVSATYVRDSTTYSLDTIRMIAKNPDTGAVSCVGRLTASLALNDGLRETLTTSNWNAEVDYIAEKTADGRLYVTLNFQNAR
jgi:hypothetical protein